MRKIKLFGDFIELRANTRHHVKDLMADLDEFDHLIEIPSAVNGALSLDDIRVLPLSRSVAVLKGLQFPRKVGDYLER
jgi:glutaredoxin 2